jgi:hypothetical protein
LRAGNGVKAPILKALDPLVLRGTPECGRNSATASAWTFGALIFAHRAKRFAA